MYAQKRVKLSISEFAMGMGKILDINTIKTSSLKKVPTIKSDSEAFKSDWEQVGDDIRSGITEYEEQLR
ncbi:hypothetical protein LL50_08315 [Listeria monocytogenes]|nr:hypothetical protein [Listeria monocytogenes]EAC9720454.1 hypothetical protein [Listeria monocytogenes]EAD0271762.1 hypothetical protein [Listeria monocytogenes]EAD0384165.1 hypothetical protein [Listeria monocytogenes]EAF2021036.1 hypothetical protein [Listeria monocytogenes]